MWDLIVSILDRCLSFLLLSVFTSFNYIMILLTGLGC